MGFFVVFVFVLFLCFPLFLRAVGAQMHLGRSHWNSFRTPNLQCKQDTRAWAGCFTEEMVARAEHKKHLGKQVRVKLA